MITHDNVEYYSVDEIMDFIDLRSDRVRYNLPGYLKDVSIQAKAWNLLFPYNEKFSSFTGSYNAKSIINANRIFNILEEYYEEQK